jgi:hypothetical protein
MKRQKIHDPRPPLNMKNGWSNEMLIEILDHSPNLALSTPSQSGSTPSGYSPSRLLRKGECNRGRQSRSWQRRPLGVYEEIIGEIIVGGEYFSLSFFPHDGVGHLPR